MPCGCPPDQLCDDCLAYALLSGRGQAQTLGQLWAEKICRGDVRAREWSEVDVMKANAIARQRVATLGSDARLVDDLAREFLRAAAGWWEQRPARYRT